MSKPEKRTHHTRDAVRRLSTLGRILAHPVRVEILGYLTERGVAVSDLVARLGIEQPRVSYHLGVLRRARVVSGAAYGRQYRYQLVESAIRVELVSLAKIAPASVARTPRAPLRRTPKRARLRQARTCYDHLAGALAAQILIEMHRRRWILPELNSPSRYTVTQRGARELQQRGVSVFLARASQRALACACHEWRGEDPHLGGALGAAIFQALIRDGIIVQLDNGRDLLIPRPIGRWLR